MKVLAVFALALVAAASASSIREFTVTDTLFLERQRDVLEPFRNILQLSKNPRVQEYFNLFKFEDMKTYFTNVEAYEQFVYFYHKGFLPRHEVFSIFNEEHREQAVALFHVFFYAKDFETFMKTAAWTRQFVNEGMFAYSYYVALLHRTDCRGFYIPPVYEVFPRYFFNDEVFRKAEFIESVGGEYRKDLYEYSQVEKLEDNKFVIYANYSGWYVNYNEESKLSYFTEDIGLNQYYFFFHADYPFWMAGEQYGLNKDRRGEMYYYFHQQLLARFYMERLSNGMGEIPTFSWEKPIKTGFYNSLANGFGMNFFDRPNYYHLQTEENYRELNMLNDYEERIREIIDFGYYFNLEGERVYLDSKDAINTLGNIVQANADSPNARFYRYFLAIARSLLGSSFDVVNNYYAHPSALEQFETTLRDPMFWQLYKRVMKYFFKFQESFGPYTREELIFPGVNVKEVEVEKLVTFFEYFDTPLYNGFVYEKETPEFKFAARQLRLAHQPFNVKIHVDSDKNTDAVIRIFLGPKYDFFGQEFDLEENRVNFFELDAFRFNLKSGQNIIERNSEEFFYFGDYSMSSADVYHKLTSDKQFYMNETEVHFRFPSRLMLPKGTKGGMPFQFYVIVSPYVAPEHSFYAEHEKTFWSGVGTGARFIDNKPLGFPFDREIGDYFYFPNMYFKDVIIFHKSKYALNKNYFYQKYEQFDEKHMY